MPKIRIREKDMTAGTASYDNENIIFLVDKAATEIPVLLDSTSDVKNYDKAVADIISFGGKVVVCDSYENAKAYLKDRNQFNIKLLMVNEDTGDSPTHADLDDAVEIATSRRDCAVVYSKTTETYSKEELAILNKGVGGDSFMSAETKNYAGKYVLPFYGKNLTKGEAGLGYVLAFLNVGNSTGAEWLAVAGSKRGVIPGKTLEVGFLTEDEIDKMQSRTPEPEKPVTAINPIVNMNPWGVRIWGNRTALTLPTAEGDTDLVASSFANIRILICDIKKALYQAARTCQFEQNSDILWVNFTSQVNILLEQMKQSYGIAAYRWIREETTERAKIKAILRIVPIEAVEDFDLTVELADSLEVAE